MTIPAWETIDHPQRWNDIHQTNDIIGALEFRHSHNMWLEHHGYNELDHIDPHPGEIQAAECVLWIHDLPHDSIVEATLDPALRQHVPAFDHFLEAAYLSNNATKLCETAIRHVGGRDKHGILHALDRRPISERTNDPDPSPGTRLRNLVDHREGFFALYGPDDIATQLNQLRDNPPAWGSPTWIIPPQHTLQPAGPEPT